MSASSRAPALPRCAVLLAIGACATQGGTAGKLRAADAAQAIEGAPNEAQAQVGPVAVRAAIDDWRGQPADLEMRLTPVDVTVANGGPRPLRIGPEAFRLVTSSGSSLRVLTQDEVASALQTLAGFRRRPPPRVGSGAVGGPTFPGHDAFAPYGPGSGSPVSSPVPPPGQRYETQLPSGALPAGRQTSMILYFDTPARSLDGAALEIQLVDEAGAPVGNVRLPFARQ